MTLATTLSLLCLAVAAWGGYCVFRHRNDVDRKLNQPIAKLPDPLPLTASERLYAALVRQQQERDQRVADAMAPIRNLTLVKR